MVAQRMTVTSSVHHNFFDHSQSVSGVSLVKKQDRVDIFVVLFVFNGHRLGMKDVSFNVFVSGATMNLKERENQNNKFQDIHA